MKRTVSFVAAALALSLVPAFAGEKKKCSMDPADCKAKMKAKIAATGWLGVELEKNDDKKVVVTKVVPDSPATAAAFHEGDVLVAFDGIDYYSKDEEAKEKVKKAWSPGNKVTVTVLRDGAKTDLDVEMGNVPAKVAEKKIKEHMKAHHSGHDHDKHKEKEKKGDS